MTDERLMLYVVQEDPDSKQAVQILRDAGFNVVVRTAPIHYRAAYGVPVLFSRFGISQGLAGVRRFVENVAGATQQ